MLSSKAKKPGVRPIILQIVLCGFGLNMHFICVPMLNNPCQSFWLPLHLTILLWFSRKCAHSYIFCYNFIGFYWYPSFGRVKQPSEPITLCPMKLDIEFDIVFEHMLYTFYTMLVHYFMRFLLFIFDRDKYSIFYAYAKWPIHGIWSATKCQMWVVGLFLMYFARTKKLLNSVAMINNQCGHLLQEFRPVFGSAQNIPKIIHIGYISKISYRGTNEFEWMRIKVAADRVNPLLSATNICTYLKVKKLSFSHLFKQRQCRLALQIDLSPWAHPYIRLISLWIE